MEADEPAHRPSRRIADLRVEVVDRQRRVRVPPSRVAAAALRTVEIAGGPARSSTVAVLLAGERTLRVLNRHHRGVDRPTDVLSFADGSRDDVGGVHLGDVAISIPAAERQARAAGWKVPEIVERLVVHGVLHLLGHDHEVDDGEMMRLQARVLRDLRRRAVR